MLFHCYLVYILFPQIREREREKREREREREREERERGERERERERERALCYLPPLFSGAYLTTPIITVIPRAETAQL